MRGPLSRRVAQQQSKPHGVSPYRIVYQIIGAPPCGRIQEYIGVWRGAPAGTEHWLFGAC